jgi:hypothetical protein
MTDLPPSPLEGVSPDALTVLFESDPLTLTDAQLLSLISELRRRRNEFTAAEAVKALKPKTTRTRATPQSPAASAAIDKPLTELSLDDLD